MKNILIIVLFIIFGKTVTAQDGRYVKIDMLPEQIEIMHNVYELFGPEVNPANQQPTGKFSYVLLIGNKHVDEIRSYEHSDSLFEFALFLGTQIEEVLISKMQYDLELLLVAEKKAIEDEIASLKEDKKNAKAADKKSIKLEIKNKEEELDLKKSETPKLLKDFKNHAVKRMNEVHCIYGYNSQKYSFRPVQQQKQSVQQPAGQNQQSKGKNSFHLD